MDNSVANNANRVAAATGITLNGGALSLVGLAATATTQTVGPVTLNQGSSTINSTLTGTGTATLTLSSLIRTSGSGATAGFTGTGTINITNVTGTPLVGGLLPYATYQSGTVLATIAASPTGATDTASTVATTTAGVSESGNVVTVTTASAHGFLPGQTVTIAGVAPVV